MPCQNHEQLVSKVDSPNDIEIYKALMQRFLSDNNRIWFTGSIFIPIALSAYGLFATIKNPGIMHAILLGFASTLLVYLWNLIAERHRQFQDESRHWLQAFEQKWGLPKGQTTWHESSNKNKKIGLVRKNLVQISIWAWSLIAIMTWFGFFSTPAMH